MSEDNILNLEEEPSAPVDPAEMQVEVVEETGTWEQELSSGLQQLFNEGLSPIRVSIASLEESLRAVTGQLDNISSIPLQNGHLNSHVSGLSRLITQTIDDHAAKTREEFSEQLEAERDKWNNEVEARLSEARLEVERTFEPRLSEIRREVELEWQSRLTDLASQLAASREALALTVRSIDSAPVVVKVEQPVSDSLYLKSAVAEINSQRTQADTLTSLIRNASHFAARVAFFVVRGGLANGWKANGFSNGLDDETVRTLSIPVDNTTLIGRALLTFETVGSVETAFEVGQILGRFGTPAPERAIAIPLVVRGRAAAVLYADCGSGSPESDLNQTALELIMDVGSMGIELLPTRRSEPAPTVRGTTPLPRPEAGSGGVDTPPSVPGPAPTSTAPSPYLPPPATDERFAPGNFVAGETRELSRASIEIETIKPAVPSGGTEPDVNGSSGTVSDESAPPPPSPVFINADEADGSNAFKSDGEEAENPSEHLASTESGAGQITDSAVDASGFVERIDEDVPPQIVPSVTALPSAASGDFVPEIPSRVTKPVPDQPAAMREAREMTPTATPPVISPGSSTETEQRAHNDARRFARLLVSEIKLYNGSKVSEGRRNHDLYTRLSEEITRSRKVYEKRVSPAVAARFDYFYDELVQTLAEGDKEKLGVDCPGPILR